MEPFKYTYFNIACPEVGYLVPKSLFDRQLVYSVLFEPGKLIIPDAWVFGCRWIGEDILSNRPNSLLRAALRRGHIAINFRKPRKSSIFSSFEVLLDELRKERNVGILPKADMVAGRLTPFLELPNFAYETWPPNMGEKFMTTIKRFVHTDNPPKPSIFRSPQQEKNLKYLWTETTSWRQDLIEKAYKSMSDIPDAGLKQSEIIRQLMTEVGGNSESAVFLSDSLKVAKQRRDLRLANKVSAFIRWIWECHQYTQSISYRAAASFPLTDKALSIAPMSLLPPIGNSSETAIRHRLSIKLKVPDLLWLAQMYPEDLLSAREQEGANYLNGIAEWRDNPSSTNTQKLIDAGDLYAKRLNSVVAARDLPHSIVTAFVTRQHIWPTKEMIPDLLVTLGWNALEYSQVKSLDWPDVIIPWLITRVTSEGCSFYSWWRIRRGEITVRNETTLQGDITDSRLINFSTSVLT